MSGPSVISKDLKSVSSGSEPDFLYMLHFFILSSVLVLSSAKVSFVPSILKVPSELCEEVTYVCP